MNSKNDLLTCKTCSHWTFKNAIGYCSARRATCPSEYHICKLYKPKATEPETLTCMDCANYTYLDDIGRCPLQRSNPEPETPACSLFKPKATEPEPEQERVRTMYPYLGIGRSSEIVGAIYFFLKSDCTYESFVDHMCAYGFATSVAHDLAHYIEQFKEQKPEPVKYPTHCLPPNWRAYLDTLRSSYMNGHIDMDVVLAALDPSRSESNVVCDLVSVWEGEKERLRSGKNHLDYLRDMIDIHAPDVKGYDDA